jgi:hypothetical protein
MSGQLAIWRKTHLQEAARWFREVRTGEQEYFCASESCGLLYFPLHRNRSVWRMASF